MSDATNGTPAASLERATLVARRDALQATLLTAMQQVERLRGAVAVLDELLAPPPEDGA